MPEIPSIRFDLTYLHARREALYILLAWLISLVWTVGYSAIDGYDVPIEQMTLVLGMPSWIVWGVMTPWGAATLFSVWFSLYYMKDDPLGEAESDTSHAESVAADGRT